MDLGLCKRTGLHVIVVANQLQGDVLTSDRPMTGQNGDVVLRFWREFPGRQATRMAAIRLGLPTDVHHL